MLFSKRSLKNYNIKNSSSKQWGKKDISQGKKILSLMGYATEDLSEQEIISLLNKNSEVMELKPRTNVKGTWVHALKQTKVDELKEAILTVSSLEEEICVTDANEKSYWDFFGDNRRFGLVFEGTVRVFWNADMYSTKNEYGKLEKQIHPTLSRIKNIDEMTEGWLTPEKSNLIGIRIREGSVNKRN